jgi:hypothetical protein
VSAQERAGRYLRANAYEVFCQIAGALGTRSYEAVGKYAEEVMPHALARRP